MAKLAELKTVHVLAAASFYAHKPQQADSMQVEVPSQ